MTKQNGGKHFDSEQSLSCGNREGLRNFRNLRTQLRVLVPATLDQRPQTVRARWMFRSGRSIAPKHGLHDRPICFLATERNLTGEYLCFGAATVSRNNAYFRPYTVYLDCDHCERVNI